MKSAARKHKTNVKAALSSATENGPSADAADRLNCIATAAYYKAAARGFMPGRELDDWLEAEAKFDACEEHRV